MAKNIAYSQKARFLVFDDTTIRRNINFAVCKCIESIHGLVRRNSRSKMNQNFCLCRGIVLNFARFDFSLFYSLGNRFDQCRCGLTEWYFANSKCFIVHFLNLGTYLKYATTLSVIIFADINKTTSREIWVEMEVFTFEISDSCITDFYEIVR